MKYKKDIFYIVLLFVILITFFIFPLKRFVGMWLIIFGIIFIPILFMVTSLALTNPTLSTWKIIVVWLIFFIIVWLIYKNGMNLIK